MKNAFFLIGALLSVSACAPNLPATDMVPMTQVYNQIPRNPALEHNIKLGSVTVFKNAGGSIAPVKDQTFQEALNHSLLTSGMAARYGDVANYTLDAHLNELKLPLFG